MIVILLAPSVVYRSHFSIECVIAGQLWQPKISFNVNALYEEVVQGNNRAVSTQAAYDED
ncbi:hypothetical protein EMUR_00560 [Ehrlichia muris AS145]|uniref:Uncharacterized protein n=1 Tax=Ehrlichia muris AS145 TaxID=1423892 RepID=V9R9W9_9RICK|nr:hypothetical protein EMUR_00560 [Ehrlichia muris AS145]